MIRRSAIARGAAGAYVQIASVAANVESFSDAGLAVNQVSVPPGPTRADADRVFKALHRALGEAEAKVLIHREVIDDNLGGLLAGYLVWSGMVAQPIMAVALVQEILRRPLGPEGRALVPDSV